MADLSTTAAEYDRFADIYAIWTETAASSRANQAFYVDTYREYLQLNQMWNDGKAPWKSWT